jgi:ribosome-associated translation inhibitor RaiA
MLFLIKRLRKAKKVYNEINDITDEIEKELMKVKEMLTVCQK